MYYFARDIIGNINTDHLSSLARTIDAACFTPQEYMCLHRGSTCVAEVCLGRAALEYASGPPAVGSTGRSGPLGIEENTPLRKDHSYS